MAMLGGTGEEMEATQEVQQYCEEVKSEILQGAGKDSVEVFKALKYKTQLVAGTNYFVKIQVSNDGSCIHVRLFQALPCYQKEGAKSVEVAGVQTDQNSDSALEYF